VGEKKNAYRLLMGKLEGKNWVGETLKWILEKEDEVTWIGLIWLKVGQIA
jgi:hypothetical protein